MEKKE
jgi:cysteine protease ATG4